MSRARVSFVVPKRDAGAKTGEALIPWLETVVQQAATFAKQASNIDTGFMRSSVDGAVAEGQGPLNVIGVVFAQAEYALWQELEPGDPIPVEAGGGQRARGGGKPFLRPGVVRALTDAGVRFG